MFVGQTRTKDEMCVSCCWARGTIGGHGDSGDAGPNLSNTGMLYLRVIPNVLSYMERYRRKQQRSH